MFYVQDAELFIGYKIMNKTPFPTCAAYNIVEEFTVKSLCRHGESVEVPMKQEWPYVDNF